MQTTRPGLVYKITNQEGGPTSYLIGTYHIAEKEAANHPELLSIIHRCKRLYTECGYDVYLLYPYSGTTPPRIVPKIFTHEVDLSLTLEAFCRNIRVLKLDKAPQNYAVQIRENENLWLEKIGIHMAERIKNTSLRKLEEDPRTHKIYSEWKSGNLKKLERTRTIYQYDRILYKKLFLQREKEWIEQLAKALQNPSKSPLCIAVGALHLVNEDGLANKLKEKGFKVELIPNHQPVPLPSKL